MVAIAIDGPAGAGKSTIARAVAAALGYLYLDTGALYRAVGLFAAEHAVAPSDAAALAPRLREIDIEIVYRAGEQRILLSGRDVSEEIRRPEIGMAASAVAALPEVRSFLLEMQRGMAVRHNVVMDGRDVGTVVLPNADVKIFLTASAPVRAQRRCKEYLAKGREARYEDVLAEMNARDRDDSTRAVAPLRQAQDAILVDTSDCSLEESIARILDVVKGGIG